MSNRTAEQEREYRRTHLVQVAEYQHKYYETHKGQVAVYTKAYKQSISACIGKNRQRGAANAMCVVRSSCMTKR